jgi:CDP-diacylglycerol--glycerol-3-phosphate 3-phosphatidyltransferase
MSSSIPQSQASMLATLTTDLDKIAPKFEIPPEQIRVIRTPAEFYETLKVSLPLSVPQSILWRQSLLGRTSFVIHAHFLVLILVISKHNPGLIFTG